MSKVEEVLQDIKAFIDAQLEDLDDDEKEQVLVSVVDDLRLELENLLKRRKR